MSAGDQLPVRQNEILRRPGIVWIGKVATSKLGSGKTDVIDPFEEHDMADALQREGVSIEASQTVDTKSVPQ